MALKFTETKGKALSNKVDSYDYQDGEQKVRMFGDILPRYMYWIKGTNNKDIPVECLSFNRDKEKFDNIEKDWVPEYHPIGKDGKPIRCSWAYAVKVIDPKDGKAKVLNLKKKLFEQIITAAESLGDPTDPETGWDIVFKRVKTGQHAFNVEYTLMPLKCKPRALSEEERAAIATAKKIDEEIVRPTPDEVKALLDKIASGASEEETSDSPSGEAETAKDL